jgi:hypothetical protein
MCACTETDVRESANDCILASEEGHGSRGETLHPICAARPVSSSSEHSIYIYTHTHAQPKRRKRYRKQLCQHELSDDEVNALYILVRIPLSNTRIAFSWH